MTSLNIDSFTILEPRIDWISVVGEIPHIIYDDPDVAHVIENQFYDWGFNKLPKRDRLTFRSNIMGVEISLGKKRNSGNRYVKIEIQGKGCADTTENTEAKIKEIIKKVWNLLGVVTPPHATRLDLAVDVLGAKLRDIFPDISDKRYELVTNSKKSKRPTLAKFYKDPLDISQETGFSIGNSRFEICTYDRMMAIHDKYIHQENAGPYCEYYLKLYEGFERVLRVETRLSKELCEFFNIAFFTNKKPLREILPEALAHFNHNHSFKDVVENRPLEQIDRLYFSSQFKTIKTLKTELGLDLSLKKLFFNFDSTHYEVRISQLARSLVKAGKIQKADLAMVLRTLIAAMSSSASSIEDDMESFRKTCEFMSFHPEEAELRKQEFLSLVRELRDFKSKGQKENDDLFKEIDSQLIESSGSSNG